ncbi:hypothetical protein QAD02_015580 [Eretmocerus hayati]|uniref:Uncharacterized protein n=1 Tax=Eretmocerus hayati TaxID=131215 RepID=A0ACC2P8N6_9HYME|nr:hypothetical protein QAD02_015580 [Eretmocerus hayati]
MVKFTKLTNDFIIVSRSDWGAKPGRPENGFNDGIPLEKEPAPFVIIHHSHTPTCTNRTECEKRVRSIQNYHMNSKMWRDIGYNFLVGEDGNAYEGRGWGITGAHAVGYNSKSIGICVIGSYVDRIPNDGAIEAVKNLIAHGVSLNKISSNYTLKGHRQVGRYTACPGDNLYKLIQTWPHWSDE